VHFRNAFPFTFFILVLCLLYASFCFQTQRFASKVDNILYYKKTFWSFCYLIYSDPKITLNKIASVCFNQNRFEECNFIIACLLSKTDPEHCMSLLYPSVPKVHRCKVIIIHAYMRLRLYSVKYEECRPVRSNALFWSKTRSSYAVCVKCSSACWSLLSPVVSTNLSPNQKTPFTTKGSAKQKICFKSF